MVVPRRVHIFGASGSGTTTLGAALGQQMHVPHLDTDDFYWQPTDPPFQEKHPPEHRIATIRAAIQGHRGWVLSGSLLSWGGPLVPLFELAVFVTLDPVERMRRLLVRERARYGSRIEAGGDLEGSCREFLDWAATYDDPDSPHGRSRANHERWIGELPCPVLRLDSIEPLDVMVERTIRTLEGL